MSYTYNKNRSGLIKRFATRFINLSTAFVLAVTGMAGAAPLFIADTALAAGSGDVWITAAMPEPNASDPEYVTVKNMTTNPINLDGWKIDTHKITAPGDLAAGASATICENGKTSAAVCTPGYSISTPGLNNNGDTVTLYDNDGNEIDQITYADSQVSQGVEITFHQSTVAPSNLTYAPGSYVFTKGQASTTAVPTYDGDSLTSCTVSPTLPAGLTINPGNCVISGTPTVLSTTPVTYTVTASNAGGAITADVAIAINDVAPSNLTYSSSSYTFTTNDASTTGVPTHTGGSLVSCTVSPALPAGLTIDHTNCEISGTPTAAATAANYTVTAANSGGSTTTSVSFAVNTTPTDTTGPAITVNTGSPKDGDYLSGVRWTRQGQSDQQRDRFIFNITDPSGVQKGYMNLHNMATGQKYHYNLTQHVAPHEEQWYADIDTTNLPNGVYQVEARAVDKAGNARYFNNRLNSYAVTIDNTAPSISIKDDYVGNKAQNVFSNVSFKLHDNTKIDWVDINGYHMELSDGPWSDANYSAIKSHLHQGTNNTITLYDVAGNTSSYTFTYDTVAPIFGLTDDGNPRTPIMDGSTVNPTKLGDVDGNGNSIRFTKESTTDTLYVNGQPIFGHGYFNKGKSGQIGAAFKNDGTYTLYTKDLAGNQSAPITFTVDTVAPAAPTITAPGARTWHKSSPITDSWTEVTKDVNGNDEHVDHYQVAYAYDDNHGFSGSTCSGVTIGSVNVYCRDASGTSRNHQPNASEQGGVTIWVRAIDDAGNVGAWSKSVHYYYDHEAPKTDIHVSGLNTNNIANATFTVEGDASDNLSLNRVYLQLVRREDSKRYGGTTINLIPNGINPNGIGAHWSHTYDIKALGLPDGIYAANVEVVDMAGNTFNPGWTDNFTIDSTKPQIEFTNPTSFNNSSYDKYFQSLASIAIKASDANGVASTVVHIYNADGSYSSAWCGAAVSDDTASCDASGLADGNYYVKVAATDNAGNTTYITKDFTIDSTAPTITIDSKAPVAYYNGSTGIHAHVTDDNYLKTVINRVGTSWTQTYVASKGQSFALAWMGDGTYDMTAYDEAGNASQTYRFTIDGAAPSAGITSASQSNKDTLSFDGYVDDANFNYYYCWLTAKGSGSEIANTRGANCVTTWAKSLQKNGNPATSTDQGDGSTTSPVKIGDFDITGLASGDYTIHLVAIDLAGNKSTEASFDAVIDHTAPTLSGLTASDNGDGTWTISGVTDDPSSSVTVTLTDPNGQVATLSPVTADPTSGDWSVVTGQLTATGTYNVSANSSDAAGNAATAATTSFTISPAPQTQLPTTPQQLSTTTQNKSTHKNVGLIFSPAGAAALVNGPLSASPLAANIIANSGNILGTQTNTSNGNQDNNQSGVKGDKTTKQLATDASANSGWSWWWLLPIFIVLVALIWFLLAARRRQNDEKA